MVMRLKDLTLSKAAYAVFLSFWFYKRYYFVINPCGSYSRCVKFSFVSFGSIRTKLRQSYCYYFYCLVVCFYHFYKKDSLVGFFFLNGFKMATTKSEKP